jgi:two-component system, NarL family, sensor histidine kinase BarA
MDLQQLPIIDWDQALKLAGNKQDIAKEILEMLVQTLPREVAAINQSWQDENYEQMSKQVHKLHGALCYCGLPRLKTLIAAIENDLKTNVINNLPHLLQSLNEETKQLLSEMT